MRGLLNGDDISSIVISILYNQYPRYWGSRGAKPPERFCESQKRKHGENAIITSFSRYAEEEGELLIVRPIRGPHREIFLEILDLLLQNFLMENP